MDNSERYKIRARADLLRMRASRMSREPHTQWMCKQVREGRMIIPNGCPLCQANAEAEIAEKQARAMGQ